MDQKQSEELTKQGITALKNGDKRTAAQLLHQATKLNPSNQVSWLWLAGCVDSNEDKRVCLEKVIAIDATSEAGKRAAKGLEQLTARELPVVEDSIPSKQQVIIQQPQGTPEGQSSHSPRPSGKTKKQSKKNNLLIGCLSVLGIFFFCGLLGMLVSDEEGTTNTPAPTNTPKPEHSATAAELMCQQFIEDRLKAPATAKYAPLGREGAVEFLGDSTYQVLSYVDSQNSFGAMLRTKYLCEVQYVENDRWKLVSLVTDD